LAYHFLLLYLFDRFLDSLLAGFLDNLFDRLHLGNSLSLSEAGGGIDNRSLLTWGLFHLR
jgi:hypothetical protein